MTKIKGVRAWARYLGEKFVYADTVEPIKLTTNPLTPFSNMIHGDMMFWDNAIQVEIRPVTKKILRGKKNGCPKGRVE